MTAHILVIEDEEALSTLLRYNLESEGYEVETISDGEEADLRLRETIPDLVLLDWMLPKLSGIEICRRLRKREQTKNLPVIMLTARGEEAERIQGLATGADDYVVKPFSVPELMARVKSMLRRSNPAIISNLLSVAGIELNRDTHKVSRNGRVLRLGPTEFRLLDFLMCSPERVYSREQLLDGVWGHDHYVDERTVDVHIGRLRQAITRGKENDPIRTVRGTGYALRK